MKSFLGITCILVVCVLNVSSVNKNLHDLICIDSHSKSCGSSHSNCSNNPSDSCNSNSADNEGKTCDSIYCAVNIFSDGLLVLDFASVLNDKTSIDYQFITELIISHHVEENKKSHLVRGPPEKKRV